MLALSGAGVVALVAVALFATCLVVCAAIWVMNDRASREVTESIDALRRGRAGKTR